MVKERIIFGAQVFRVCDFSRVYEILNFMLEADTSIYGMASNLVKLTIAVWVKTMYVWGGLEMVKGLRRPFWIRQSRTLDKGWLKFENLVDCWTTCASTA